MNSDRIREIDNQISELNAIKVGLMNTKLCLNNLTFGDWVIIDNRYFQFIDIKNSSVRLSRFGVYSNIRILDFIDGKLPSTENVDQHLRHLELKGFKYITVKSKEPSINPMTCDFYMVTCRGLKGTKTRHGTYERAEEEATRITKLENHETWIVGVVASVKPVITTTTIINKKF